MTSPGPSNERTGAKAATEVADTFAALDRAPARPGAPDGGEPKRRGRRPGSPKTSGSGIKKGQKKTFTNDLKEEILVRGQPIKLLCDIARGVRVRVGAQAGPNKEYVYPSLEQRISASRYLADKLLPNLRSQEVTGDPDKPTEVEATPLDDRELARQVALILYRAAPRPLTVASEAAASDFRGTQPPQGALEAEGHQITPDTGKVAQEPCNESTISPPPPGRGKSLWFGRNLEIRNVGPVRDGLPPMYVLHRGGQEVMRSNWGLCLAKAEKLLDGVPLPKDKLADTRTETVPLHVRADQLPPLPQRGYATRRHAR